MSSQADTGRVDGRIGPAAAPVTVRAAAGECSADLVKQLGLSGFDAVVVLGGGNTHLDPGLQPRLTQLIGRGLLRALGDIKALYVLRASDDALSALVSQSAQAALHKPTLLGVAPLGASVAGGSGTVTGLDHLLLVPGERWGDEARTKIEVAHQVAAGRPVFFMLMGGDASAIAEARLAVRYGWNLLIVPGTGGAADALAAQSKAGRADGDDPAVAEILADGNLTGIPLGPDVAQTVEMLSREVMREAGGESVLAQAWRRFAAIDAGAKQQQKDFELSQKRILALGVLTVLIAISHAVLQPRVTQLEQGVQAALTASSAASAAALAASGALAGSGDALLATLKASDAAAATAAAQPVLAAWLAGLDKLLALVLIGVPVLLSALIAATNRFNHGKRWVLLRSAAEGIKSEIYRYRLDGESYAVNDQREKTLAKRVEDITRRMVRTEVNTTALPIYSGPIPPVDAASPRDNGMSRLSTDQYVRLRLHNQLGFYRGRTVRLEMQMRWLHRGVLASGGVGTLLAVPSFGLSIWIALTTAITSALVGVLAYRQVESTLTTYNQTATDLENILAWWTSLEPAEQAEAANIKALTDHTEDALGAELASWTQRMSDALEKLREAQTRKEESSEQGKVTSVSTVEESRISISSERVETTSTIVATQDAAQDPAHRSTDTAPPVDPAGVPDTPAASDAASGEAAPQANAAPGAQAQENARPPSDSPVPPGKPTGTS
jgi:hypothetical protein